MPEALTFGWILFVSSGGMLYGSATLTIPMENKIACMSAHKTLSKGNKVFCISQITGEVIDHNGVSWIEGNKE